MLLHLALPLKSAEAVGSQEGRPHDLKHFLCCSLASSKSPVTPTVRDPALQSPTSSLRRAALSFDAIPSIYKRKQPGSHQVL